MESFNSDFCDKLNVYLMKAMHRCSDPLARGCSMDGVLMPFVDSHLRKKYINDVRMLETHVWGISNKGDIKFDLIIYFGKYSLRRYAKSSALDDCLQPPDKEEAVKIDFENQRIEVQLL